MDSFNFFDAGHGNPSAPGPHPMPAGGSVKSALSAGGAPGELTFSVENISAAAQTVCIFQTPFEDFRADILEVRDATGAEMAYVGVRIKRGPPKERHFLTVEPGATLSATFRLDAGYRLDGAAPFTVRFKGAPEVNGLPDSNAVTVGEG
jgi:hypothetical protein